MRKSSKKMAGPGQKLKIAREERKLTVEEVAEQLRLHPTRLSEIEGDDYRELGSPAFARGYLRNYARLLSMSEQEILEEFDTHNLGETIHIERPNMVGAKQRSSTFADRLTRWIVLSLGTISVIGAITWWYINRHDENNALSIQNIKQVEQTVKEAVSSHPEAAPTVIVQPLPIQSVSESGLQTQPLTLPQANPPAVSATKTS